jgi:16S rRNA (uracil1498-N3)-methyltransferase
MSKTKHTFFCSDLNYGLLNEEESNHAIRVLRLNLDDEISVVNGKGRLVIGKITSTDRREVGFEIMKEELLDIHPLHLHVAIAPTKNIDRFMFFLEKATEMGCAEISPIFSSNSERRKLRTDKSLKSMVSALKQSGNLFLPILNEPRSLKEFLPLFASHPNKMIAHCGADVAKIAMSEKIEKGKKALILIGPEGDFTPEEVILAQENGFSSVSLGESRFRTETAGIIACHTAYLYL